MTAACLEGCGMGCKDYGFILLRATKTELTLRYLNDDGEAGSQFPLSHCDDAT